MSIEQQHSSKTVITILYYTDKVHVITILYYTDKVHVNIVTVW